MISYWQQLLLAVRPYACCKSNRLVDHSSKDKIDEQQNGLRVAKTSEIRPNKEVSALNFKLSQQEWAEFLKVNQSLFKMCHFSISVIFCN